MNPLKQLVSGINQQSRRLVSVTARPVVKWLGFDLLSKAETRAFLTPYRVSTTSGGSVRMPGVLNALEPDKVLFSQMDAHTAPTSVWFVNTRGERTGVFPCGLVQVGRRVLNTDYWSRDVLKDMLSVQGRKQRTVRTLVAPFGHYFDGDVFVGYYDYLFLVAAKLARMKAALPAEVFENALVAYPMVHTPYETEILSILGFRPEQLVDSRTTNVQFEECILGDHENWAYQTVGDVLNLKNKMESQLPSEPGGSDRIYISRTCRRRVLNESALIRMLERYNFQIIADQPRTVAEQRTIYKNAAFILGPHGASFSNMIWCAPGTHLMELFSPHFIPDCFRYLAQVQGLTYSGWSAGAARSLDGRYIGEDITVPVDALERYLKARLAQTAP